MNRKLALAIGRVRQRLGQAGSLIAICVLLSSSSSLANAQSWQCHAPEGTVSERDFDVPGNATQFTGEMVIHKANGLSEWHPKARVGFTDRNLDPSGCHCNGVVAEWYPQQPDFFLVSLSVDGKEVPLGRVPYDKPVRFKFTAAWDGALKLEVGTGVATGRSSILDHNNLHMSCSTADVAFNVTVAPPPAHTPERCPFAARERWPLADVDRYCRVPR